MENMQSKSKSDKPIRGAVNEPQKNWEKKENKPDMGLRR